MMTPHVRARMLAALSTILVACQGVEPTSTDQTPSAVKGKAAFVSSCASCHASLDGFDLLLFGFSDADIVRRAVKHVSPGTAADIAAYVHTLGISAKSRDFRLFQPTGTTAGSDEAFWTAMFGVPANVWPNSLTIGKLRELVPREIALPFGLPVWSSELTTDDWMPDNPLSSSLLSADGGALQRELTAYYGQPSDVALLVVVNRFRRLVYEPTPTRTPLCEGEPGFQVRAIECFDAMRWISSLTAMHFARRGLTEQIPMEVVRLWWETGEAGVSEFFRGPNMNNRNERTLRTAGWLALGFSYAPLEFEDQGAYFGQFLSQGGYEHFALFMQLYRMVNDGPVNSRPANRPDLDGQRIRDGSMAVYRAPVSLRYQAAMFVMEYLIQRIDAGERYRPEARDRVRLTLQTGFDAGLRDAIADEPTRQRYEDRRAILDSKLEAAFLPR